MARPVQRKPRKGGIGDGDGDVNVNVNVNGA